GQYEAVCAVDDLVRRPRIIGPNKDNGAAGEGNVDIAAINVASDILIPGDYPIGISDDGRNHSGAPVRLSGPKLKKADDLIRFRGGLAGFPAPRSAAKLGRDVAHEERQGIDRGLVR